MEINKLGTEQGLIEVKVEKAHRLTDYWRFPRALAHAPNEFGRVYGAPPAKFWWQSTQVHGFSFDLHGIDQPGL